MTKSLSFYVVYPSNERLRSLLNALKVLADENQRSEAHITVRGPYVKQLSSGDAKKFSTIISNETLNISKVDNFFGSNQNTVFFSCDRNENLKSIWKKMTYNEFRPHITIYDGDDRDFAIKLHNALSSNFRPFKYEIAALSYLQPKTSDTLKLYHLKTISDYNSIFEDVLNISKNEIDFSKLTQDKRLDKISKLANCIYDDFSQ